MGRKVPSAGSLYAEHFAWMPVRRPWYRRVDWFIPLSYSTGAATAIFCTSVLGFEPVGTLVGVAGGSFVGVIVGALRRRY